MKEQIEKAKAHIKEHKKAYIVGAISAGIAAGFTIIIMRGRYAGVTKSPENSTEFNIRPLINGWNNSVNTNIVNVLEREGRGHPGYMIRCKELDTYYPSQLKTAEAFGGAPWSLSGHLLGKFSDFCGYHFERVHPYYPEKIA